MPNKGAGRDGKVASDTSRVMNYFLVIFGQIQTDRLQTESDACEQSAQVGSKTIAVMSYV